MRKELKIQTIFPRIMWYDETIKNMAFQRDKVLGSCMTEDEEEAKMLNAILDELKLNALVITDPYNMRHVSGFRGGARLRLRKNWSIWQEPKKSGTKHLQNF